jgi:oligopeptidase B
LYAVASDGKKVPVSIVYRKGTAKDGKNPLLLYGYGSYGSSQDASFSPFRISLLDGRFVFALAHVRGGQEMGREWYEDGKLFKKKNTFTDFIACAEYLVKERYTSPDRLFAHGGSAGGLLIGAVVNLRPEAKACPNLLVTTSLHDSQVQYFEPAKWFAKLRAMKTDNNLLLLRTLMEAGQALL